MKPLFVKDKRQIIKTAGQIELSDDSKQWPQEILNELYRQSPFIDKFSVEVDMEKVDSEQGYGYGSVKIRNKSLSQSDENPTELVNAQINEVRVPILIKDKKLFPLDLLVRGDKKTVPMTQRRLNEMMFKPTPYDVLGNGPGDKSIVSLLEPAQRKNYNFGGGGFIMDGSDKLASIRNAEASILAVIHNTLTPEQHEELQKEASEQLLGISPYAPSRFYVAEVLDKLASAKPFNLSEDTDFNVMQIESTASGYTIKVAHSHCWEPKIYYASREEAIRNFGPELIKRADIQGDITLSTVTSNDVVEPKPQFKSVTEAGAYKVRTVEGKELLGFVIPTVFDVSTGNASAGKIFTNGSSIAIDSDFAGERTGDLKSLPESEDITDYGFFYHIGSVPVAVEPMKIISRVNMPDEDYYLVETMGGNTKEIRLQRTEGIKIPASNGNTLYIPRWYKWMPLDTGVEVVVLQGPQLLEQEENVAEQLDDKNLWVSSNGGTVKLEGPALATFNKQASLSALTVKEAAMILAGVGVDQFKTRSIIKQASEQLSKVKVRTTGQIQPKQGRVKAAQVRFSRFGEELYKDFEQKHLFKIAADLEDPQAINTILSLGFINPENASTFVSFLPKMQEVQENLCNLLFAARIGEKTLPHDSLEKSIRALEQVIVALKSMAFR